MWLQNYPNWLEYFLDNYWMDEKIEKIERIKRIERINRKTMRKTMRKIVNRLGKILVNYLKLLLIPFVFIFMLFALLMNGIKNLIEKATV